MKVYTILKNLWKSARSYSDNALQTSKDYGESLRVLDYDNAISPLSADVTTSWTYTAPNDGILFYPFVCTARSYVSVKVNNVGIHDFAFSYNSSYPSTFGNNVRLSKGDVFSVSGLSSGTKLSSLTKFVPFKVGGVILNHFRRVVVA